MSATRPTRTAGLVPILNQLLNLNNSPVNVNVLGIQNQQFEWCEDQD
ncbi:hypothetical protein [Nonomuraea dietziae]